ncbi:uncharacterized protein LTR77_008358 [Saxophila tyrrhenica]|uniref:Uncharacterized protein n=1 Tax=Saxophila tyrrhenica TaxID=1690608 RepID=A0AAV9P408_9PEZI|nr:hypothetical protein LTR77_008358 [Saxophila tyrrhenica]
MASPRPHARTQSSFSTTPTSASYTPSGLNPNRSPQSTPLRDTAYNGSEGLINDLDSTPYFDGETLDDSLPTAPARVATTPARPAFGARLLSSLSNAQPAAAALGRKGSVLHSRAKSLAAYVPKLNTANTPSDAPAPTRAQAPNRIFGDLFNGESAPIRLGAPISPTKEKEETEFVMEYTPTFTDRPTSMFTRRDTASSNRSTPPTQTRKASWFVRRSTATTPSKASQPPQDELANLNISSALFPNGPADPLSPASFNDLLLNATSLLDRMQIAYKEKCTYIASLQPELDAQREEVEEAETRSQHLKMQLEDMGRQAQERERAMQDLSKQLTEEKMWVQELRENSARTVRLVREESGEDAERTPTRRGKRISASDAASDSGFESDLDSVFSATTSGGNETPASPARSLVAGDNASYWALKQPNGKAGNTKRDGDGPAWATVEALRNENQVLKGRMGEMEREMQGVIDFVGGLNGI